MKTQVTNLEVNQLYESNIITKNEIPLLIGWLPKHPLKVIKLYDSEKDTHNAGAFHEKCDDKAPTVVLIKMWGSSSGGYIADSTAFLFSFDTNIKYKVNTPNYAIYCHHQYGPTFGNGHDIHIANYGPQNNSSFTNGMAYPLESQYALNKGIKNFTVKNYEVYQIIYPE